MDIQQLTDFFMWCTIINGGIYLVWILFFVLMPDFIYRMQSRLFPLSRETFNTVVYAFFGGFKLLYMIFNVVPLVALLIIKG
ncbi:hypothetical protein HUE57_05590 [Candidatus Reidiella endopervernicosa]|uniref:DUF6868 domain-containing protein n=2 Tax=Candidatus Reidiella endopervernicosa TaxID=2738883 RepID=A0A6N0I0P6_9GAMM|nr:hypothetical protein HUE57_05590 [Candidatus Reidiella endopervernicosa]